MKRRSLVATTIAAIGAGTYFIVPVLAQEQGQDGAKGLYFEQLQKPEHPINTGLKYWIELKRKGKVTQVSNKEPFYSGDRIRFHVRPNIDGYAYILLRSGSRGEQSVLFPDARTGEDNHVEHGRDYEMPADGYLAFDQNPGTEKVTLLLSRKPMDAAACLSKPDADATMIASAQTGSKDLIPAKVLIVYATKPAAEKPSEPVDPSKSLIFPAQITTLSVTHKPAAVHVKPAGGPSKSGAPRKPAGGSARAQLDEAGVITVVKTDPKGVLFIDIALNHN